MESVNVLFGRNAGDYLFLVYLFRERKLNENTVYFRISVERVNKIEQLGFGCFFRKSIFV